MTTPSPAERQQNVNVLAVPTTAELAAISGTNPLGVVDIPGQPATATETAVEATTHWYSQTIPFDTGYGVVMRFEGGGEAGTNELAMHLFSFAETRWPRIDDAKLRVSMANRGHYPRGLTTMATVLPLLKPHERAQVTCSQDRPRDQAGFDLFKGKQVFVQIDGAETRHTDMQPLLNSGANYYNDHSTSERVEYASATRLSEDRDGILRAVAEATDGRLGEDDQALVVAAVQRQLEQMDAVRRARLSEASRRTGGLAFLERRLRPGPRLRRIIDAVGSFIDPEK